MRILTALCVAAIFCALGCGGGGGGSDDTTAPQVSALEVTPVLLAYEGIVQASVQATDNKKVTGVKAIASGPTTEEADLVESSAGVYEGEISLPSNGGDAEVVYEVWAEARDSAGNTAQTAAISVIVDCPPLPPTLP